MGWGGAIFNWLGILDCGLGSFMGLSLGIATAGGESRVVGWEKGR